MQIVGNGELIRNQSVVLASDLLSIRSRQPSYTFLTTSICKFNKNDIIINAKNHNFKIFQYFVANQTKESSDDCKKLCKKY